MEECVWWSVLGGVFLEECARRSVLVGVCLDECAWRSVLRLECMDCLLSMLAMRFSWKDFGILALAVFTIVQEYRRRKVESAKRLGLAALEALNEPIR